MSLTQSATQPPWKVHEWFPRVMIHLQKAIDDVKSVQNEENSPSVYLFPHLSAHWEDLNDGSCSFEGVELLLGWLVTEESENLCSENLGRKKRKTFTWNVRYFFVLFRKLSFVNSHGGFNTATKSL